MSESLKTKILRWKVNLWPFYRHTGGRLTYIAPDFRELHVTIPLNRKTRNRLGTMFGGSISAAVDPFFMFMLMKLLGRNYIVWDKASTTHFKRPARSTLYAVFTIDEKELDIIRDALTHTPKIDRVYHADIKDKDGVVHATVEKVVHIRRKRYFKNGTPP